MVQLRKTSTTRTRVAALALTAAVVALVAPACSSGTEQASASMTSDVRPAPAPSDELTPDDPGTTDPGTGPGTTDDPLGDLGDQFDDLTGGLGDLGDCASLGLAYAQLVVIVFTADDAGPQIDEIISELQAKVPADLQDELQTVSDTLKEAAQGGVLDATGAMSDPEFTAANQAIADWIATQCDGSGGSEGSGG